MDIIHQIVLGPKLLFDVNSLSLSLEYLYPAVFINEWEKHIE